MRYLALLSMVALSGCVTATKLDNQISSKLTSVDVPLPYCSSAIERPKTTALAFNELILPASLKKSDLSVGIHDLSVGIEMITKATDNAKLLSTSWFNLEQFANQVDTLDEGGAKDAEVATTWLTAQLTYGVTPALIPKENARRETPAHLGSVPVSIAEWKKNLALIDRVNIQNGWTAALARSLGHFARKEMAVRTSGTATAQAERDNAFDEVTKRYLLAAYMVAYFRNGQVLQLNFDKTALEQEAIDQIEKVVKDAVTLDQLKKILASLGANYEKALCSDASAQGGKCVVFGAIGEQTFVTRAGKSYGFPGVTATIDITADKKISANRISTDELSDDLIRVSLEALGDWMFKVPGTANSTLCQWDKSSSKELCAPEAKTDLFKKVNDAGDRTEAGTSAIVSKVIRGGWLFSLNNETLADAITTGLAVSARKTAEAVTWHNCKSSTEHYGDVTFSFGK